MGPAPHSPTHGAAAQAEPPPAPTARYHPGVSQPAPAPNRPTWLPNALVWLRLALAGVFVWLVSTTRPTPWAEDVDLITKLGMAFGGWGRLVLPAGIFIVAAITDILDGKLARAWNCTSRFGRIMDSFADKVLVLGAFVCLAGPNFSLTLATDTGSSTYQISGVYPWMAVVILGRELLITSLRGLIEGEGGDFSAIWAGKWKMVAQSVAVPLILLVLALAPWQPGTSGRWIIDITVWTTLLITVASAIPYIQRAMTHQPQKAST